MWPQHAARRQPCQAECGRFGQVRSRVVIRPATYARTQPCWPGPVAGILVCESTDRDMSKPSPATARRTVSPAMPCRSGEARCRSGSTGFAPPNGRRGHPEQASVEAIRFRRTLRVLFGLPLRQTSGSGPLAQAGLAGAGRHLCRRQKCLKAQTRYRKTTCPCICWWKRSRGAATGPRPMAKGIRLSGEGE